MTFEKRRLLGWLSVAIAWGVFAVGTVICFSDFRAWPAWGACYLLALALWFPVPLALMIWRTGRHDRFSSRA